MIEELLDQYSTDKFDDLLIDIIKRMKERKESEELEGRNLKLSTDYIIQQVMYKRFDCNEKK